MKNCKQCNISFEVTPQDLKFYEKIDIPEPELCPVCRMQQRLMYRNFFNLYHRKCDLTGKSIISMYDEDAKFPVYDMHAWWGDEWDDLACGRDFDFSRPFFEQLKELFNSAPRMNISNTQCENTDYCNFSFGSRNCYMVFGNVDNEDCYYGHIVWQSKNCFDCLYTYRSEFCYECTDCVQCNGLSFCTGCDNCSDSRFLVNCNNCRNCFGCVGLKNKEHCIFNKPYSKEDYEKKMSEFNQGNIKLIEIAQSRVKELVGKEIVKHFHGFNCENVTGDYLYNCKNVFDSYDAKNCEDSRYLATAESFLNCYDANYSPSKTEWSINVVAVSGYKLMSCHNVHDSANIYYADNCYSCKDCFACAGLKGKKYCILNKQYSKEEYEDLKNRIIGYMKQTGEWGEFFPPDLTSFAYNETMAQEYIPLSKEEIESNGWRWKEKDEISQKKGSDYQIPDDIKDVSDDISDQVLICEKSGKHYKIIPQELKFYRAYNLPIPRNCFDQRQEDRMTLRNPRHLFDRKCAKCQSDIKTTYSPDRPETVYCEACYLKSVY
ncbi:hypothetical protein KJ742_05055 [Patescibacteria group bacterium]|nr:hypothetical protein [Patescibacteria group bacterium]MBU1683287.1 hypothetical protein [Patescibacteria group bacterium]MBU1934689.1 hypothetical protein [Patescibacteria group bacterium]